MKFLVTGAAGFIGFHVCQRLLESGHEVVGIDNMNDYYDVSLKQARLDLLKTPLFSFYKIDLAERVNMEQLFATEKFNRVIHLAAQAGVRYSLENPHAYADAKEGANKQVISSQADSLIKISRIWADFFPANTSNQPI
ncbi:SDR family NAD(P)-dependent oxidoreductase, partial [Escherichia coli]|uniref:SDR family NAD(P)-dependent oxidoreductase n=4 Tax=Enterobacterales TaxID=91347 RepID=UPI00200F2CFD|nr:SDR family NAD(P)-dependent oxidoreductase [Escherichia coli]MCV5451528.1 SDR family NAD(P)-dependent oxidoreductase [Escherichia coli]MDQ8105158.1 SDR family NAD(P)-dependent oxidoreductase [Escherichia coli]